MVQSKEERNLKRRIRYQTHKDIIQAQNKKWLAKNLEKSKAYHAYRRKRRHYWLDIFKRKKACENCGYNKCSAALDFAHIIREDKKSNPSWMINHSLRVLFQELRKCKILCSNCHREETFDKNLGFI